MLGCRVAVVVAGILGLKPRMAVHIGSSVNSANNCLIVDLIVAELR